MLRYISPTWSRDHSKIQVKMQDKMYVSEDASEDASEDGDDDSVSGDDGVPDEVFHIDIPFKDMFECVDECVEVW